MSTVFKQRISKRIVLGKSILDEAQLGQRIEIFVQSGSIIILPAARRRGWEVLGELGKDAKKGALKNPSERHNDYLYGKRR